MKKSFFTSNLLAVPAALPLALVFGGSAHAQNTAPKARTIYLYNASLGTAPASINAAKSGPWGNGTVSNSRRVDYEGAPALEVVTRNFQEGARFDFTTPVNLDAYQDTGFLRLRLRFRDGGRGGGMGGFPGGRGFPGGDPMGGGFPGGDPTGGGFQRGGRQRDGRTETRFQIKPRWNGSAQFGGALPPIGGGFPGRGFPGGTGDGRPDMTGEGFNPEGGGALPMQATDIKEIAVTLLRDNGVTTGRIPIDLEKTVADDDGWRLFVLPIKNMTSTPGASGAVQRAILTSDAEDTIYLAQAALVIESGEMTVSIRRPEDVVGAQIAEVDAKPGAVSLIADVEAGAADPIVEWNFDADNVGNLPPGVLSSPPELGGGEGDMTGMEGMPQGRGMGPGGGLRGGGGSTDPRMRAGAAGGPRGGGSTDPRMRGGAAGGPRMGATGDPRMGGAGGIADIGPRLDARGLTATFEYPNEEQNYRVEVTVSDRSGIKQPVKASILVRVRG